MRRTPTPPRARAHARVAAPEVRPSARALRRAALFLSTGLACALGAGGGCHLLSGYASLRVGDGGAGGTALEGGHGGFNPDNGCKLPSECPATDSPCRLPTCLAGECHVELAARGKACGATGAEVCDAAGECQSAQGLLANGAACSNATQCYSAACEDDVCCDRACTGGCEACDIATALGSCTPHGVGTNPESTCAGHCDGSGQCASGTFRYGQVLGGSGDARVTAVSLAPDGSAYIAGDYSGDLLVGGDAYTSQGARDIFVAHFDAAGTAVWTHSYGDAAEQHVVAIAALPDGVMLTGNFNGTLDFGTGSHTSAGGDDIFVAALDAGGGTRFLQHYGDAADQEVRALALAPDGTSLWIAGSFSGALDLGGGALVATGTEDAFLARLGANGAHAWSRRFGGAGHARALTVAVGNKDRAAVAGTFDGSIDFDDTLPGGLIPTQGGVDLFAALFDPYGNAFGSGWPLVVGDADDECPAAAGSCHLALAVSATGPYEAVTFAGTFHGSLPLGGGVPLQSAGGSDIFVARLFENGFPLWVRRFGDGDDQVVTALATDATGNAIIGGWLSGSVVFAPGVLVVANGSTDGFVAKLSTAGIGIWAHGYGSFSDEDIDAVAVDPAGRSCFGGAFAGGVTLGAQNYTSEGGIDGMAAVNDP